MIFVVDKVDCHEILLHDSEIGRLFQGARTTQEIVDSLPTPFAIINMAIGEESDQTFIERRFRLEKRVEGAISSGVCFDYGISDNITSSLADEKLIHIVQRVLRLLQSKVNVHIHCAVGISRSSYLSTAVLMALYQWDYDRGLAYLRKFREHATPNKGFETHLRSMTERLHTLNS